MLEDSAYGLFLDGEVGQSYYTICATRTPGKIEHGIEDRDKEQGEAFSSSNPS